VINVSNRSGSDPNNHIAGHSLISDPWGEVLAETGEQQEILTAEINLDLVKKNTTSKFQFLKSKTSLV